MAKRRSSQLDPLNSALGRAPARRAESDAATKNLAGEHVATQQASSGGLDPKGSAANDVPSSNSLASELTDSELPLRGFRRLISLAIIIQGFSLLLAFSSNLAPSYLQGRMLEFVGPYLHVTHQYYHALPLELTRAEPLDFPLQVELQLETTGAQAGSDAAAWQPLVLRPLFSSDRTTAQVSDWRWQNLARWLSLIASADSESEILSDFAARAIELAERQSGKRYQAVRFLSAKVLSYDEDLALAGNLRVPEDEIFQPSVIYSASVVRLSEQGTSGDADRQRLSLIPAQAPLRTAKPVGLSKELP